MIARSFKSVAWVAAIGAAALICYMFSLRGAAERAELSALNAEVIRLERSIRTLQTELGTRGRVHQLQHWASADFGFVAPVANQFLEDEVTLARFDRPAEPAPMDAPVRMAEAAPTAPAPQVAPAPAPAPQLPRVIQASAPRQPVRATPRSAPAAEPILRRAAVIEPIGRPEARPVPAKAAAATTRPSRATPIAATRPARATPVAATRPARAAPTAATTRPVARATPLVSQRTLRDLSSRERTERSRAGAN